MNNPDIPKLIAVCNRRIERLIMEKQQAQKLIAKNDELLLEAYAERDRLKKEQP
jgi:hypothetical protein